VCEVATWATESAAKSTANRRHWRTFLYPMAKTGYNSGFLEEKWLPQSSGKIWETMCPAYVYVLIRRGSLPIAGLSLAGSRLVGWARTRTWVLSGGILTFCQLGRLSMMTALSEWAYGDQSDRVVGSALS
jgi:hypothetical protein